MWFTVWLVVNLMHGVVNVVHRVQRAHGVRPVQFAPFGPEALKRRAARAGSNSPKRPLRSRLVDM